MKRPNNRRQKAGQTIDGHFSRNTFSISAVEFCWGLGLPLVMESAFLQLHLRQLGASQQAVGLVPAILSVGFALGAPLSSFVSLHFHRKRGAVIVTHVLAALPFVIFGLLSSLWERANTADVFLAFYAAFALLLGMSAPLWQNFLMNIFTPARALKALSVMWFSQVAARLLAGFVLLGVVEKLVASGTAANLVFGAVGLLFGGGALFFLVAHENEPPKTARPERRFHSTLVSFRAIVADRRFLLYLLSTLELPASVTVLSFYATFAVEQRGISAAAAAGGFTIAAYAGGMLASVLLGMWGILQLKWKMLLSKTLATGGIGVLVFANSLHEFLLCSALIGFSRSTYALTHAPAVKLLAQKQDATDHFSLAPFLTLPFSFGIPALAGFFLESSGSSADNAFRLMFLCLAGLVGISALVLARVEFPSYDKESPSGGPPA